MKEKKNRNSKKKNGKENFYAMSAEDCTSMYDQWHDAVEDMNANWEWDNSNIILSDN